jgi:hypothetical protein
LRGHRYRASRIFSLQPFRITLHPFLDLASDPQEEKERTQNQEAKENRCDGFLVQGCLRQNERLPASLKIASFRRSRPGKFPTIHHDMATRFGHEAADLGVVGGQGPDPMGLSARFRPTQGQPTWFSKRGRRPCRSRANQVAGLVFLAFFQSMSKLVIGRGQRTTRFHLSYLQPRSPHD